MILTHNGLTTCVVVMFHVSCSAVRRCYHVIKEVHSPVERLADASDVLEPLGPAVVLVDFVDGKAGCRDRKTRQHTHSHKDLEHSLDTVKNK